jgi:tetratricopeptide (TPR) repeat protein
LRKKKPEVVEETGDRLEKRAYALIVENGYQKHDCFPVLEAAWPSVVPALARFLAGPNDRLQTVCRGLQHFLEFTGRWDESLALNQQAENRANAVGDHRDAGWRAYQAGWIHYLHGRADAVLACAERAGAHWQTEQIGIGERSTAIQLRGHGHRLKKDYPAAIVAYRESLDLHRSMSIESQAVAIDLNWLANAERDSGDFAAAERNYRESIRISLTIENHEGVAISTGNLAALALDRKDWQGAEALAREALSLSEKLGRQQLIASNCRRIAEALVRQAKGEEGSPFACRSVEIYSRLSSPAIEAARETLKECEEAGGKE